MVARSRSQSKPALSSWPCATVRSACRLALSRVVVKRLLKTLPRRLSESSLLRPTVSFNCTSVAGVQRTLPPTVCWTMSELST